MRELLKLSFAVGTLFGALNGPVLAADEETGRIQFMQSCAVCHGEDGRGGAIDGKLFTQRVPDLTKLAAESGGPFPFDRVLATIDGRGGMRGHRSPMPIWGNILQNNYDAISSGEMAEMMAQGAILSVTLYLATIQEY